MKENELIDRVVEICLTHIEHYSAAKPDGDAVKLSDDDDHFWLSLRPDRVEPGELLRGSAEHRQKRIVAWRKLVKLALEDRLRCKTCKGTGKSQAKYAEVECYACGGSGDARDMYAKPSVGS